MLVGLDVLKRGRNTPIRQRLKGGKLGLLTHAPAVDEDGLQTWQVLSRLALAPEVIFSPEHGFDPIAEAEVPVEHDDADVGDARLISLYGKDKESLAPSASDLQGLDVLLIDLVDVGARYYTYAWTALLAARAAQRARAYRPDLPMCCDCPRHTLRQTDWSPRRRCWTRQRGCARHWACLGWMTGSGC